jgi:hypothetical protein
MDKMSRVVEDIRALMNKEDTTKLNKAEIWKKFQRLQPTKYGKDITRDNFDETLNHYRKLSILWIDGDENVIML